MIMKRKYIYTILGMAAMLLMLGSMASCTKDLDRYPTNDVTPDKAYKDFAGYMQVLAKVYGAYALTGNEGPAGSTDVQGLDEGSNADFFRGFFNAQVLTTDEAICAWGDVGIPELNFIAFTSSNPFMKGLYYRCLFQISMVNEFLRESTDDKISQRGISATDADKIRQFRAEVRFLRAYQYWALMDIYGNPPFIDENSPVGKYLPEQIQRAALFSYIESELLDILDKLAAPRTNEYGRVDQGAAWALLARLYLNAKVYTGTERYTDAITYALKVINGGYVLKTNYKDLFLADNNANNQEVILSINYDGVHTKGYGGLHFVINSSFASSAANNDFYGVNTGWGGNRARKQLADKFDLADGRRLFAGSKSDVESVSTFADGLAQTKYRNVTSANVPGAGKNDGYVDTDMPIFRLAEMYMIYAEAVLRGGTGGTTATALTFINKLRERAYAGPAGNIINAELTLDFVLDERARELYWEGFRRTDLIRYNRYTTADYIWQWKGGTHAGRAVGDQYNIFPLPASDLVSNPKLKQNPGY